MDIAVIKIDSFKGGTRDLCYTVNGGTVPLRTKDGTIETCFSPGSLVLASGENVIVGPITFGGAIELADAILDGNERAVTDPQAMLVLAAAVAGFCFQEDEPSPGIARVRRNRKAA